MVDRLVELRHRHPVRRSAATARCAAPRRSSPKSSAASCPIAVIGIPKTIDNDIHFIDRSFGFEIAFAAAVDVIRSAHVEATRRAQRHRPGQADGAPLGLHRLPRGARLHRRELRAHPRGAPRARGRARASCACLEQRLAERAARRHRGRRGRRAGAVRRAPSPTAAPTDASGNARLKDIGLVLRDRITAHFAERGHWTHPQVHRPELPDPQRSGLAGRQRLLLEHGPQRRARGDGRQHRHAHRPVARPLRPRAACRWRRASASRSTSAKTSGCRSSRRPGSRSASVRRAGWRGRPARLVAERAVQQLAEAPLPPLGRGGPGAAAPGRPMADVLVVSAGELGHPIAVGILVKADDRSLRHRHLRAQSIGAVNGRGIPSSRRAGYECTGDHRAADLARRDQPGGCLHRAGAMPHGCRGRFAAAHVVADRLRRRRA